MTPADRKLLDDLRATRDAEQTAAAEASARVAELERLERLAAEEESIALDRRREEARQAELRRLREVSIPHPSGGTLGMNLTPTGLPDSFRPWAGRCPCGCIVVTATSEAAAAGMLTEYTEKNPVNFRREPEPAAEQSAPMRKKGRAA